MGNDAVKKTAKDKSKIVTLQLGNEEKDKIKDYHDLSIQIDVLLLADMFKEFRKNSNMYPVFQKKLPYIIYEVTRVFK